jgi:hypothetical protein
MSLDEWNCNRPPRQLVYDDCREHWHYQRSAKETYKRQRAALTRRNFIHLAILLGFSAGTAPWWPLPWWHGVTAMVVGAFLLYRSGVQELRHLNAEERHYDALHYALQKALAMDEREIAREVLREITRRKPPSL